MSSFDKRMKEIDDVMESMEIDYVMFCPKNAREEEVIMDDCENNPESVNVAILRIYDREI